MKDARVMRRRLARYFLLILAVIAIAGLWWRFHDAPTKETRQGRKGGQPPVAVSVATVQQQDVELSLTTLGTVTSANTVTVRSRVDGQVVKIYFSEGESVEQDQLLAEIDPRPFQAALTQAQGQLLRDQALLRNAELDLVRYKQLLAENSIASQQVDTQKALIQQYQGVVKLDEGQVDNARLQLSYTKITAPISGNAGLRQVDAGNIVHASDAGGLVVITQTQPINVVFAVPEISLGQVLAAKALDPKLQVQAWDRDRSHKLADGVLLAIDNQLNTSTGTVNMKATFANSAKNLFPNQFVNVLLQLGKEPAAVTVPTAAVQLGKDGKYVYTVNEDQTVTLTKVATGVVAGPNTVISQGLQPGQRVVVDGLDKLRDGGKIEVIEPNTPGGGEKKPRPGRDSGDKSEKRKRDAAQ